MGLKPNDTTSEPSRPHYTCVLRTLAWNPPYITALRANNTIAASMKCVSHCLATPHCLCDELFAWAHMNKFWLPGDCN